jgi:hypothetical protein
MTYAPGIDKRNFEMTPYAAEVDEIASFTLTTCEIFRANSL